MLQTAPAVSPEITVKQSSQSKVLFLHLAPPTAEEWEGLKILNTHKHSLIKTRLHIREKTTLKGINEAYKALECNKDRQKTKILTSDIKDLKIQAEKSMIMQNMML